jgi:uncharacterized DUF497 family protein
MDAVGNAAKPARYCQQLELVHALFAASAGAVASGGYQRRRPEATALYKIVREHRATLFAEAAARSASGRGYPRFVVEEFDKYERCGILAYGLVRVYCETCRSSDVVAFSCKGRALCPSCTGRRMADVTTHLVDDVLPTARYRQWTLTFPWQIRVMLVQHPALVTALQKIVVRRIGRFLRRHARDHGVPRSQRAHTGAVVAIQRFGSRLNLHIHFHAVIPDTVWVLRDGALVTVDLPPPTDEDVDCIVRDICRRVTAYIDRRTNDGALTAPASDNDCDDARDLAQLVLTDTVTRKPSILDDFPAAANRANRTKHLIWFEEAQAVFDDPLARVFFDEDHSSDEDRFVIIGISVASRLLVVVLCYRKAGAVVRIISARKATKKEQKFYEEGI